MKFAANPSGCLRVFCALLVLPSNNFNLTDNEKGIRSVQLMKKNQQQQLRS